MKKIICLLLCMLMLVPLMAFGTSVSAADSSNTTHDTTTNVAVLGSTYASSEWNLTSPHRSLIDNNIKSSWEYWRPSQASKEAGIDQYFGIKFKKYYELHSLKLYARRLGSCDPKYTVKALVDGEYKTITTFTQSVKGSSSKTYTDDAGATCIIYDVTFPEPVNTKNIRVYCEYSPAWEPVIIQEAELYGHEGYTPKYDLPDGALLSSNACLGAMLEASSAALGFPAAFAAQVGEPDGKASKASEKYWKAKTTENGSSITAIFEREFNISQVSLNFGLLTELDNGTNFIITVELCYNDYWMPVATNESVTTSTGAKDSWYKDLDTVIAATGMRVTFVSTNGKAAQLNEMGAKIADDEKAVFLSEYLSEQRMQSLAGGNLAPYGTVYASSTFDFSSASEEGFLNDGGINDTSFSWIAGSMAAGEYCGVVLREKHDIQTVVLYFNDDLIKDNKGDHVLSFDIMAKDSAGNYKKVASGTSYDEKTKKYQISIQLSQPVNTDDIRVVFTSNGQTFPYLKELEVYATNNWVYPSFDGYPSSRRPLAPTTMFADKSSVSRAKLLDKVSPIQSMMAMIESANMARFI